MRKYLKLKLILALFIVAFVFSSFFASSAYAFRFASFSDSHAYTSSVPSALPVIAGQISALSPNFAIVNGDVQDDGFNTSQLTNWKNAVGSLANISFPVRGNHDDHIAGSAASWSGYWNIASVASAVGATNYFPMLGADNLTYSFDYDNSRFIGVDEPGSTSSLTDSAIAFVDQRLADAESKGLTHAFIYLHGPAYCVGYHCSSSVTSSVGGVDTQGLKLIAVINKHPIVSATFNGHEHDLAWTHINSARVPQVTHEYEQFMTSSSGGSSTDSSLKSYRVDWAAMINDRGFAVIDVSGPTFSISYYRLNSTIPIKTLTFTKGLTNSPTATPTTAPSSSATPTSILSTSPTSILTPTPFCVAPSTSLGYSIKYLNILLPGDYKIWSRIMAPDTTNNSYYVTVDDSNCPILVGDSSITANNWTWVDYGGSSTNKVNINLTSGIHTLKLIGREQGVKLDKVLVTQDQTCVPIGTGDNCTGFPTITLAPTLTSAPSPTSVSTPTLDVTSPSPILTAVPTVTPTPGSVLCTLTSANWNPATTNEGNAVTLNVNTSGDCIGKKVIFDVRRNGLGDTPANLQPQEITLSSNSGFTTWIAEHNPLVPLTDPDYYFNAITTDGSTIKSSDPMLHVTSNLPTPTPTPLIIPSPTPTLAVATNTPTLILPTPTPSPICNLTAGNWNPSNAVTGQTVFLNVTASGECIGRTITFDVRRNGLGDTPANLQPQAITLTSNSVSATWIAEHSPLIPLTDPDYYFNASVSNGNTIKSSDPMLHVTSGTPPPTPTPTPAPIVSGSITLNPVADSYVDSLSSSSNYGKSSTLGVDGGDQIKISYLRFDTSSLTGKSIIGAKLRLYVSNDPSNDKQSIRAVDDNTWSESAITYNTKPILGSVLNTTTPKGSTGVWIETDVTTYVKSKLGNLVSFGLDQTGTDGINFYSRNGSASNRPQLIIDLGATTLQPPTSDVSTVSILPTDDARVEKNSPNSNYGTSTNLSTDNDPVIITYMKFNLASLAGKQILSAKLHVRISSSSTTTQNVKLVDDTSWSEKTITYNNRPALSTYIIGLNGGKSGNYLDVGLTNTITAKLGGYLSLGIDANGTDGFDFYSKEKSTSSYKPILIVTYK